MTEGNELEKRISSLERGVWGEEGRSVGLVKRVDMIDERLSNITKILEKQVMAIETDRKIQKAREEANEALYTKALKLGGLAGALLAVMNLASLLVNLRLSIP